MPALPPWLTEPAEKNGPTIADLPPDAHDCIMVEVVNRPTEYKAVTGISRTSGKPAFDPLALRDAQTSLQAYCWSSQEVCAH